MSVYVDTSALAKWYLSEPFSEDFEQFINQIGQGVISRLTVVEFRCLLARRRRATAIDKKSENSAWLAFERDVRDGFWRIEPVNDGHLQAALGLIETLGKLPLRTLDAIHLAVAKAVKASQLATADKTMADAATSLDLKPRNFF